MKYLIALSLLLYSLVGFAIETNSVMVKDYTRVSFPVSEVTPEEAQAIYQKVLDWKHIPFYYPDDGCDSRAYEIGMLLEQEGIIVGKIIVEGVLWVTSPYSTNGAVGWWMHIAPFIHVREGNKTRPFVIDPTLFHDLVSEKDWLNKIKSNRLTKIDKVFYKDRFHYDAATRDIQLKSYHSMDVARTKRRLEKFLPISQERESMGRP